MNYLDLGLGGGAEEEEERFEDKPEEIDGREVNGRWVPNSAPPVEVQVVRPANQSVPPLVAEEEAEEDVEEESPEEQEESEEEVDVEVVLSDARLRLEMGKLYELIMKHDLFAGVEADPKAVKAVQKKIRQYAQECMEIMLGMRQEKVETPASFPMELFPFNSLEVDILKAIAATATKGESRDAEPLSLGPAKPAPRTTLNPIGGGATRTAPIAKPAPKPAAQKKPLAPKAQTPIKRTSARANEKIQEILREEGLTMEEIDQVMNSENSIVDEDGIRVRKMTEAEIVARNKQISLRNRRVENPNKTPMPTPEQLEQMYTQRAMSNPAAQKPGWRELIDMVKVMPPTIANNDQN